MVIRGPQTDGPSLDRAASCLRINRVDMDSKGSDDMHYLDTILSLFLKISLHMPLEMLCGLASSHDGVDGFDEMEDPPKLRVSWGVTRGFTLK